MNLNKRISLLAKLGDYLREDDLFFKEIRERAYQNNKWFTLDFSRHACSSVANHLLNSEVLLGTSEIYNLPDNQTNPKTIGLVMAGNIPLVGIHDLICVFLSGHHQFIKLSSKDSILMQHIIDKMIEWEPDTANFIKKGELLKGCDAYIATGSDNSSRYFEAYFSRYPHIIRKNRTSIAILNGDENDEDLVKLADDVHIYFGLGCRNVTQIYVPDGYNFEALLHHFRRYDYFRDHDKYRNNFDYQLTIAIMNNRYYMSNESIVLLEDKNPFSPISQLHYQFYTNRDEILGKIDMNQIQCIVGQDFIPFGKVQNPGFLDFPDGIDTMNFLNGL
ncbi:MAG: hypothetical protein RLZZ42_1271 [Bacteroidota bacterium]